MSFLSPIDIIVVEPFTEIESSIAHGHQPDGVRRNPHLSRRQDRQVVAEVRRGALSRARMADVGGPGPMFGQVHHFVKYNKGKAPMQLELGQKERQINQCN
jgi:hypothetical protein